MSPTTSSRHKLALIAIILFIVLSSIYTSSADQHQDDSTKIPVNIKIEPVEYLKDKVYVATGINLTAKAEILSDRFKNESLTYQWSSRNKTIITDNNASQIVVKFDKPSDNEFLKVLVFEAPNITGVSEKSLVVRESVVIEEPVGKLFLEHGELLNVSLHYKGTGPFRYCYRFCYRMSRGDDCSCERFNHIEVNQFSIGHYLRYVGNYTLLVVVDNTASKQEKHYSVKIIDTVREQTVPYVPIVCSISAVFILLSGVALHLKFKKTIITESAEFDSTRQWDDEEDWEEVQSFHQRVRYILCRGEEDDEIEQYGSRTRLA